MKVAFSVPDLQYSTGIYSIFFILFTFFTVKKSFEGTRSLFQKKRNVNKNALLLLVKKEIQSLEGYIFVYNNTMLHTNADVKEGGHCLRLVVGDPLNAVVMHLKKSQTLGCFFFFSF